jgi:asparagine synthase (glutamine-hydrolysing)
VGLNIRVHNNCILSNFFNKDCNIELGNGELLENVKSILPGNFDSWSLLQKNQFLEMKTLLSGYLLSSQGDRMSMAHSVEGRYPFLDHRLVEKIFYYPDVFKLNGFSQKHILRKAFRRFIPASIIDRPKMPYQAPDLKSFFKGGSLSETASHFLSRNMIKKYGVFDEKYVDKFIRKFQKGVPDQIGYRDNMLATFLLSSQIASYWMKNPVAHRLEDRLKVVEIIDY